MTALLSSSGFSKNTYYFDNRMFGDIRQCVSEIDSHFVNRYGTKSLPAINLHHQLIHSQVMAFLKLKITTSKSLKTISNLIDSLQNCRQVNTKRCNYMGICTRFRHWRSSQYAEMHVRNKNSNIQGRSPNVVKVIFHAIRNCS